MRFVMQMKMQSFDTFVFQMLNTFTSYITVKKAVLLILSIMCLESR